MFGILSLLHLKFLKTYFNISFLEKILIYDHYDIEFLLYNISVLSNHMIGSFFVVVKTLDYLAESKQSWCKLKFFKFLVPWLVCLSQWLSASLQIKGRWFKSQFRARAWGGGQGPVGGMHEAITHWCFSLSLPPSLPLCLKINK